MGNLCSSPQNLPLTPGQELKIKRDEVTKVTYSRLDEEFAQKDASSAKAQQYVLEAEDDEPGHIKTIVDEMFNKENWEYAECSKEDFKGAYALTLHCADGSSLAVFVGMSATSVLPEFDMTAESQMAFKSLLQKNLGLRSSLYDHINTLREAASEMEDASSSAQPQEIVDEFDEPGAPVIQKNNPSSV